ncbi:hypothetical protein BDN71DRAFT_805039 [Pleurotus eryngii]|uniref:Uncharacterized protein n=1 Tax=Pleurotus eryngii TaxID=5323 RepID=A0A9P6A251_PLEER|nr:hypothetical protein BDN71DRAFT_805039 [Pleurotus eryngii]
MGFHAVGMLHKHSRETEMSSPIPSPEQCRRNEDTVALELGKRELDVPMNSIYTTVTDSSLSILLILRVPDSLPVEARRSASGSTFRCWHNDLRRFISVHCFHVSTMPFPKIPLSNFHRDMYPPITRPLVSKQVPYRRLTNPHESPTPSPRLE